MGHSNIWNAHPKTYGPGSRTCRVCGNPHGLIRKYGIMCCRQYSSGAMLRRLVSSSIVEEFSSGRFNLRSEEMKIMELQ